MGLFYGNIISFELIWGLLGLQNLWPNLHIFLVGGFNPSEKYESHWVHLPQIGMQIKNIWNHHLDKG